MNMKHKCVLPCLVFLSGCTSLIEVRFNGPAHALVNGVPTPTSVQLKGPSNLSSNLLAFTLVGIIPLILWEASTDNVSVALAFPEEALREAGLSDEEIRLVQSRDEATLVGAVKRADMKRYKSLANGVGDVVLKKEWIRGAFLQDGVIDYSCKNDQGRVLFDLTLRRKGLTK